MIKRCSILVGIALAVSVSGASEARADADGSGAGATQRSGSNDDDRPERSTPGGAPRCEPTQLHRTDAHYSNLTQYDYYESIEIRGNGCTLYPKIRIRA